MKTSMPFMSLLLFLFLLSSASKSRGSRLLLEELPSPQLASSSLHYQIQEEVKVLNCGSDKGHCGGSSSSSGKNTAHATRKLITNEMTTSTSTSNSNSKGETKNSNTKAAHSGAAQPPQQQTFPDILDIAGMDYSPAKRKPPIHN